MQRPWCFLFEDRHRFLGARHEIKKIKKIAARAVFTQGSNEVKYDRVQNVAATVVITSKNDAISSLIHFFTSTDHD